MTLLESDRTVTMTAGREQVLNSTVLNEGPEPRGGSSDSVSTTKGKKRMKAYREISEVNPSCSPES